MNDVVDLQFGGVVQRKKRKVMHLLPVLDDHVHFHHRLRRSRNVS